MLAKIPTDPTTPTQTDINLTKNHKCRGPFQTRRQFISNSNNLGTLQALTKLGQNSDSKV